MSALSTTLTRGAFAATASMARLTTAVPRPGRLDRGEHRVGVVRQPAVAHDAPACDILPTASPTPSVTENATSMAIPPSWRGLARTGAPGTQVSSVRPSQPGTVSTRVTERRGAQRPRAQALRLRRATRTRRRSPPGTAPWPPRASFGLVQPASH
jgi:hypothetical protein